MLCRVGPQGALQGGLSVLPSEYPPVWRNESLVEEYPGGVVHDPYRWLEDTDSPATRACAPMQALLGVGAARPCWIHSQGALDACGSGHLVSQAMCSDTGLWQALWLADTETAVMGAAAGCVCSLAARGGERGMQEHELHVPAHRARDAIRGSSDAHAELTAAGCGARRSRGGADEPDAARAGAVQHARPVPRAVLPDL